MLADAPLLLAEPRSPARRAAAPVSSEQVEVSSRPAKSRAYRKRAHAAPGRRSRGSPPPAPEGWAARLREQGRNLSRAIEMLEQALGMLDLPPEHSLARAQCLRGAGLITLIAASELLLVAGWYEAQQAVEAGTE
jgi:hypothetical protein